MNKLLLVLLVAGSVGRVVAAPPYEDRLVWVFGWNLRNDADVAEVTQVLDTAAQHGCNGVMLSAGLDLLCRATPEYFRHLDAVKQACDRNKLELIPAVFSVGYGSAVLAHDRNLAEGLPVEDALFVVKGNVAQFVPEESVRIVNGGFEDFTGNTFKGFTTHAG